MTVIVEITGVEPLFVAVNGAIFPVPDATRPIEGEEFVQL